MIKNRFVLIDAFALLYRAYHGMPYLTNSKGQMVNAVYGFAAAILAAIKDLEPEYLAVGLDLPAPTKRHAQYEDYKAHRPPAPDDFVSQIPLAKKMLEAMNIPAIAAEGYEGEDIIATIVAKCQNPNFKYQNRLTVNGERSTGELEFIIVTGDSDTFQLVDDRTKVYNMARGAAAAVLYDKEKVLERYGLPPEHFVDYKALKGDVSDNIPGVPGIGDKTAASLIQKNHSLENLYQKIDEELEREAKILNLEFRISNKSKIQELIQNSKFDFSKIGKKLGISSKVLKLLIEYKDQAFLSKDLSTIAKDAPVECNLKQARVSNYDLKKTVEIFKEYGFKSLIARLPEAVKDNPQQTLF